MRESPSLEPILDPATPPSARGPIALPLVAAFGLALSIGAGSWISLGNHSTIGETGSTSYSQADLGSGLVTRLNAAEPASLERALSQIDIPAPERARLREQLRDGKLALGLIAFWDDVVADGDAVTVIGAGVRQAVMLRKDLTPVVTPYQQGGTIVVTAVRDGGGSVTVAVMTRNGPVHLRRLLVGESIEVPTP